MRLLSFPIFKTAQHSTASWGRFCRLAATHVTDQVIHQGLNRQNLNQPIHKNNQGKSEDKKDIHTTSIMKMKAPTETMKFKSALLDKAVEGNPVMARCLKCKKGNGAAFSPYLEIQRQWQKITKQITITKIFSVHMSLICAKPH